MSEIKKHGNISVFVPHIGCPHRCTFCDQKTISGVQHAPTPDEVREICREAIAQNEGRELELAFFGGSFTAIDHDYMCSLLEAATEFVGLGINGIRLSTRPDAVGEEILSLLKTYPVAAIELGAQSLCDKVLEKNRRGHTAKDVIDAANRIKDFGFELGLQMMIGLDGETEQDCYDTTMEIIACNPDTVRIYPTIAIDNTELGERVKRGEYTPLTLEEGVARTAKVMELFMQHAPDIRIIRVGLHPSKELEESMLGGPYHPAFRELCESEIMLNRLLKELENLPKGKYDIAVLPRDISRMSGQHRVNIERLSALGYDITVTPHEKAKPFCPKVIHH